MFNKKQAKERIVDTVPSELKNVLNQGLRSPWMKKNTLDKTLDVFEAYVEFSPTMCQSILESFNEGNRTVKTLNVKQLAAAQSSSWNPELPDNVILFSKEGRLLNGQHRCTASAKYGTTFTARVELGHRATIMADLDQVSVRTVSDQARFLGRDPKDSKDSSAIKVLWRIIHEESQFTLPRAKVFELMDENYPQNIREIVPNSLRGVQLVASVRGALMYCALNWPTETKDFIKQIESFDFFPKQNGRNKPGAMLLWDHIGNTGVNRKLYLQDKQTYQGGKNLIYRTMQAFYVHLQGETRTRLKAGLSSAVALKKLAEGDDYKPKAGGLFA